METTHFAAEVVGIDPSLKMLEQARRKLRDPHVRYEPGCGEAIPLSPTDFQAGLEAIRALPDRTDNKPVYEPIDVFIFR